jgi:hypothetical protein
MTSHTPGPWTVRFVYDDWGYHSYEINEETSEHGKHDNARLIAAAPELLVSLRSLVDYLRSQECWPSKPSHALYLQDIETTLAKAEGR